MRTGLNLIGTCAEDRALVLGGLAGTSVCTEVDSSQAARSGEAPTRVSDKRKNTLVFFNCLFVFLSIFFSFFSSFFFFFFQD